VTQELLEGFLGGFGRRFYGVGGPTGEEGERIVVERKDEVVVESIRGEGGIEVVPFRKGKPTWSVRWV
jgi:dihydroorotase